VAGALDHIFDSTCKTSLQALESILYASTKEEAIDKIQAETNRQVLLTVSACHEDEEIKMAAYRKL
jgi:hypothetical protein